MYVIETVSWQAKADTQKEQMIEAVNNMVADLQQLPGFRHEALALQHQVNATASKASRQWLQLYYWDSAEAAHNSNQLMADKASLQELVSLIEPETIAIDVFTPYQESSPLHQALS